MSTTANEAKIPTRILIISDTHSTPLLAQDDHILPQPFRQPLPSADVLIHAGDMTMTGQIDEYHKTLDLLQRIDAPIKLIIAGNHDRTLDKIWMDQNPHGLDMTLEERQAQWQEARDVWTSPEGRARTEGVTFLEEGVHIVSLKNGARLTVYASQYTPDFYSWGFAYELNEDRFNPGAASLTNAINVAHNPVPSFVDQQIDIMVTHGPPYARLDKTFRDENVGCPHLMRAVMRSRPLIHCFGHIHEGWGAERIAWAQDVERTATEAMTIDEWKGLGAKAAGSTGWTQGVDLNGTAITPIPHSQEAAASHRCVQVDLTGDKALERGQETLLVNAAIMDANYKPVNAPWLVTVDLPRA